MKKNRSVVTAGCKNAVTINRYCQTTKFCSLPLIATSATPCEAFTLILSNPARPPGSL